LQEGTIAACENIELNGEDNVNRDIPIEPCPTWHDILKAASTISQYIDNLDSPIACKFEALLSSFSKQLCLEETRT